MADDNNLSVEESAENLLIGAVMGEDSQDLDARDPNKLDNGQDIDEPDEPDEADEQQAEDEEEGEAKPETKAKAEAEPEDDYIEIAGEEGQEPTRVKVADLVSKAQEYDRIESQKAEIVERVEREAVEHATTRLRQVEQTGQQMAHMLQAALQLLQPPQRPNPQDPKYAEDYDGRQYRIDDYRYQQATQQHGQAQHLAAQLMGQAQHASERAKEERETRELNLLKRAWPEFGQGETVKKFVSDMVKEYGAHGVTEETLDDALTHHWMALVAKDAMAYRAMKRESGTVKAKVEAKAPKLVRTKQAKGSQQNRDTKGRYSSDALAALKKTNSDDAAAAFFAGLSRDGRI